MNFRILSHAALLAALAISGSACKSLKTKKSGSGAYADDSDILKSSSLGSGSGIDGASGSGLGTALPERSGSSFLSPGVDRQRFAPVYFAYDSFVVSSAEQSKVASVASALKGSTDNVIVAGFTDERGTPEYNRGLGERRSQAVRQVLIGKGVNAARIQTVSFGAEMPADPASNEAAWAKNRRAEFGVTK